MGLSNEQFAFQLRHSELLAKDGQLSAYDLEVLRADTVEAWRHDRAVRFLDSFSKFFRQASWLTVGDGRFGIDSIQLRKILGISNVLPTNMTDTALLKAKEMKLIDHFEIQNLEELTYSDSAFDIVFCKETLHHLAQPWRGLYGTCQ